MRLEIIRRYLLMISLRCWFASLQTLKKQKSGNIGLGTMDNVTGFPGCFLKVTGGCSPLFQVRFYFLNAMPTNGTGSLRRPTLLAWINTLP